MPTKKRFRTVTYKKKRTAKKARPNCLYPVYKVKRGWKVGKRRTKSVTKKADQCVH